MRQMISVGTAIAIAVVGSSCNGADGTGPGLPDIVGTYNATAYEYTLLSEPDSTWDLVNDGGIAIVLTVTPSATFTTTSSLQGFPDLVETWTIHIVGDELTLEGTPTLSGTFHLNGNTLTINLQSGVTYDFFGNGTQDPSTARIVFERD